MPLFNLLKRSNHHEHKTDNDNNNRHRRSSIFSLMGGSGSKDNDSDDLSDLDNNNKKKKHATTEEKLEIAKAETRAVHCLKIVVIVLLLLIGGIVASMVYIYTNRDENDEYQQQFSYSSQQIVSKLQVNAQSKMEAIGSLALAVQAHAITQNDTWPLVTVPFFEDLVIATKSSLNAYGVALFPIVTNATRIEWEQYSVQHRDWVNASYDAQTNMYGESNQPILGSYGDNWFDELWGSDMRSKNMPDFEQGGGIASTIFQTIFDNPEKINPEIKPYNESGPFFPQWQAAPLDDFYQHSVNLDYGDFVDFHESTIISTKTGTAVLGEAWTEGGDLGDITTLLYPIFDQFDKETKQVVAFLGVDMYWQTYLDHILPAQSKLIYVVVESTCKYTFTFQLIGDKAIYYGEGDLHDPSYDDMVVSTRFGQHLQEPVSSPNYAGTPLYDQFCQYDFHIYPSSEFETQYMTNKPQLYTITICVIFIFTICVFLLYDYIVERRQKKVMKKASVSDSILSSLFPSRVKNQLYTEKQEKEEKAAKEKVAAAAQNRKVSLLTGGGGPRSSLLSNNNPRSSVQTTGTENTGLITTNGDTSDVIGKAIAHRYPETTVLFADIAGFTAWSSGRDPSDVFTLLETIYGAYDKNAVKLNVFKVETIGDCYVAVTGLPDPQPNHAIIMAKFAHKMLLTLEVVISSLVFVLGPETRNLAMRVGLHSGPVIAGILRGEKARFQLYGEEVSVAGRMEQGGERCRVHISQQTAILLMRAGKSHWLTPREDLVEVKGRGKVQTYWLEIKEKSATAGTRSESDADDEENEPDTKLGIENAYEV